MAKLGTFTASQVLTASELNAGSGAASTWVPSYSNITVGNGTVYTAYNYFGRVVFATWRLTLGTTSSIGTSPTVTLPVAPADGAPLENSAAMLYDASGSRYPGRLYAAGGSAVGFFSHTVSGSNVILTTVSATAPFTWTSTDYLSFSITYLATS
jgi:hypothetical protein